MFWIIRQLCNLQGVAFALCLATLVLMSASGVARADSFSFVALGDLPYGFDATAGAQYRALIQKINQTQPLFSVHVGDFKAGYTPCSDQEFAKQRGHFDLFEQAVVYTPGDNDWTDCHRLSNGNYDPQERLARLREVFFYPHQSLGQHPMPVESQPQVMPAYRAFVENQRWQISRTLFVTLHLVGSNNNYDFLNATAQKEFRERERANIAWIQDAFRLADERKLQAVVFAFQADVFRSASLQETYPRASGFRNSVGLTLLPLARAFGKPVLIVHGDSHEFKFNQAFYLDQKRLLNVYRLEVPGDFSTEAVRVQVDEGKAAPFTVRLLDTRHR